MQEKIYTIPVNEAFSKKDGCPFCRLKKQLEDAERELIMGASMMEPDIRIKTNERGFCKKHYLKMLKSDQKQLFIKNHFSAKITVKKLLKI